MIATREIEKFQTLKEQMELRKQAKTAEAFIAANIISLESKSALEETPEFVAVRPENFWDSSPLGVEFKKDTFYTKNCRFLVSAIKPNWLMIKINPYDHNRVERELQVRGELPNPFIRITTREFGHIGGHGPTSDSDVGWTFLNARLHLANWFGKINPTDIIMPFYHEEDLSLANILARTQ